MMMRASPNWDALAPYWHCFETSGLDKPILSALMSCLKPHVLYIGGGRGTYASHLSKWVGRQNITIVDSSLAMARRAKSDFGLNYDLADVRYLPFPDSHFGSAICATGVFEYLDPIDRITSLREMSRVCFPGNPVVITAFSDPGQVNQTPLEANEHPLLEKWFQHEELLSFPERKFVLPFNAVAREMGDRDKAYRLLRDSLPPQDKLITGSEFAAAISASGLFVRSMRFVAERGIGIWTLSAEI